MGEFESMAADVVRTLGREAVYVRVRTDVTVNGGKVDPATLRGPVVRNSISTGADGLSLRAVVGNATRVGTPGSAGSLESRKFEFDKADLVYPAETPLLPVEGDEIVFNLRTYRVASVEETCNGAMWAITAATPQ